MITLCCNLEDPRFEYPELKDADYTLKTLINPIIWVMEGKLSVGFGRKASMETCPKQRMLNTHWIVSSIVP